MRGSTHPSSYYPPRMLQVDTAVVLDALCTCFPAIWAREEGDLRYPYFDRPGRPTIRPEGPVGSNRVGRSWVDPFLGRPGRPTCPATGTRDLLSRSDSTQCQ